MTPIGVLVKVASRKTLTPDSTQNLYVRIRDDTSESTSGRDVIVYDLDDNRDANRNADFTMTIDKGMVQILNFRM